MSAGANKPAVEIASRTDPGRDPDKQVNEDAFAYKDTKLGLLAVVCDGMGGHAGGKEASHLALKTILDLVENAPDGASPRDLLKSAIEEANRRVYAMPTAEAGYRPGSTVVALLVNDGGAEIAHVGDSRIYLIHAGAVAQITRDHSMVQEMVDRNLIRAEDAASHPDANKILRALGIAPEADVELRPETIAFVAGDVFILCSDGLSDLVGPGEILDVAGGKPPAQAAGQLVDLANARGGHDNITVMVLRMKASAVVSDARTIVKTVQLTQHLDRRPPEKGSGPRGTVVEAPLVQATSAPVLAALPPQALGGAPPAAAPSGPAASGPVAIPPAPPVPASRRERRSIVPLLVGVGLAFVAVIIAGVLVWSTMRPGHVTVPFSETGAPPPPSTSPDEDAATPEMPGTPLTPTASTTARSWHEDGGVPRPPELADCDRVKNARAHRAPPAVIARLEEKCRLAGGTPPPP